MGMQKVNMEQNQTAPLVIAYLSSSELLTIIFINCGSFVLKHVIFIFFYNKPSVHCVFYGVFSHFVSFSFVNYMLRVWKKFGVFCGFPIYLYHFAIREERKCS